MDLVFAYIDPGSGAMIIQALVGGLVAIPILFRNKLGAGIRAISRAVSRKQDPSPSGVITTGQDTPPR